MRVTQSNDPVQLKRVLGLFSAVNFIISVTIGSGIFISPTSVLKYSKSVGMCVLVWSLSGVISLLGALTYAELSTLVPRSGSDYVYFMSTFNKYHRFWAKLPSFLYSMVMIMVIRPASIAVVLLTFSHYISDPILDAYCITDLDVIEKVKITLAISGLGLLTYINTASVKLYVLIQNIFGCFKVIACLIVVGGGIYEIAMGNAENLQKGFEGTTSSPKDVALAFYSGLWAFEGWSMVTSITEEIKNPEVNILRSILIAVPLVTILYVFMNISYMTVLTIEELINSSAVAVAFGQSVLGKFAVVIPLSVAFSTFSCSLSLQFGITRLCYVSGQDGLMLKSLSYVHYKKMTPGPAVVLQGIITFLFILTKDVTELIQFVGFMKMIFYSLSMVSLLILKKRMKDAPRLYKVPFLLPIFMLFIFMFLFFTPIVIDPTAKHLIALGIVGFGIIFYYVFIYKDLQPDLFLSGLNSYIQILFEAIPSRSIQEVGDEEVVNRP
ncbi:b(0,+)-type amino acid transporter 1-like [Anoplophora glabripennis]|uniref:b(0,+)-type amino acid transporter 1-like n=1 Tax=Anoplophora glabripennis TaxID=217634 RepID=UPI000874FCA1|nr:b(0,+)-type amino acid transporter 1-like [Anoplophora glabripennis]